MAQTSSLQAQRSAKNLSNAFFSVADEIDDAQRPAAILGAIALIATDARTLPGPADPATGQPLKAGSPATASTAARRQRGTTARSGNAAKARSAKAAAAQTAPGEPPAAGAEASVANQPAASGQAAAPPAAVRSPKAAGPKTPRVAPPPPQPGNGASAQASA
jgi:hypothetical protein